MTASIFAVFLALQPAIASDTNSESKPESSEISIRLGACAGLDASCILLGGKIEMATRFFALQFAAPFPQATVKLYPIPFIRFYAYGATSLVDIGFSTYGAGLGFDFHIPGLERVILQTQYGFGLDSVSSVSLAVALGKVPEWTKRKKMRVEK